MDVERKMKLISLDQRDNNFKRLHKKKESLNI